MTAERLLAWAAAVCCALLLWWGTGTPAPEPSARLVVAGLGAVVALPLALVYLGWLSSLRSWQRGWR